MSKQAAEHDHHGPKFYIKIYFILLVLLIVSILGPELGIKILTLITAFGIAIVKAYMVAAHFMHLNIERRYVTYMLFAMLIAVFLFFAGTAPDVMETEGSNWIKSSALQLIEEHKNTAPAEEPH